MSKSEHNGHTPPPLPSLQLMYLPLDVLQPKMAAFLEGMQIDLGMKMVPLALSVAFLLGDLMAHLKVHPGDAMGVFNEGYDSHIGDKSRENHETPKAAL